MPDDLTKYLVPKTPVDNLRDIGHQAGIDDDTIDDYLSVTQVESGHNPGVGISHKNAHGFGQLTPDRPGLGYKTVGGKRYNIDDPAQNMEGGLRYFAEGGKDPISRRIYYFGGPKWRDYYQRTGRIPNINDGNLSAREYVRRTGGFAPAKLRPAAVAPVSAPTSAPAPTSADQATPTDQPTPPATPPISDYLARFLVPRDDGAPKAEEQPPVFPEEGKFGVPDASAPAGYATALQTARAAQSQIKPPRQAAGQTDYFGAIQAARQAQVRQQRQAQQAAVAQQQAQVPAGYGAALDAVTVDAGPGTSMRQPAAQTQPEIVAGLATQRRVIQRQQQRQQQLAAAQAKVGAGFGARPNEPIIEAPGYSIPTQPGTAGERPVAGTPLTPEGVAISPGEQADAAAQQRERQRQAVRAEVVGQRQAARSIGIPTPFLQNPLTTAADVLGTKSINQFTARALTNLPDTLAGIGHMSEDQSVDNEVERRMVAIDQAAAEHTRLMASPQGRAQVNYGFQKLYNLVNQEGWHRSVDIGSIEALAGLFRTVAGLARFSLPVVATSAAFGLTPASDLLARQAIAAEEAVQQLREKIPLSKKEEIAAFVTRTVGDIAQMEALGVGNPTVGMAMFSGMQAAGRGAGIGGVLSETAKGAVLGKVTSRIGHAYRPAEEAATRLGRFGQEAATLGKQTAAIIPATAGVEMLWGANPPEAAESALTMAGFHIAGKGQELVKRGLNRVRAGAPPPPPPGEPGASTAPVEPTAPTSPTGPVAPPVPSGPAPNVMEAAAADIEAGLGQEVRTRADIQKDIRTIQGQLRRKNVQENLSLQQMWLDRLAPLQAELAAAPKATRKPKAKPAAAAPAPTAQLVVEQTSSVANKDAQQGPIREAIAQTGAKEAYVIAGGQKLKVQSSNLGLFGRISANEIHLADGSTIDTNLVTRVEDAQGQVLYERPAAPAAAKPGEWSEPQRVGNKWESTAVTEGGATKTIRMNKRAEVVAAITELNKPTAATEPAKPATPAAESSTGFIEAFGAGAHNAVTDGWIDSAWDRLQAGKQMLFQGQGSAEKAIQDAFDAGRIKSREDVARELATHQQANLSARKPGPAPEVQPKPHVQGEVYSEPIAEGKNWKVNVIHKGGRLETRRFFTAEAAGDFVRANRPPPKRNRKGEAGFINISEIHDALQDLAVEKPELSDKDLEAELRRRRPYLFVPNVSRARERQLMSRDALQARDERRGATTNTDEQQWTRAMNELQRAGHSPSDAQKIIERLHPDLARRLEGDMPVQELEDLAAPRAPGALSAAEKFARESTAEKIPRRTPGRPGESVLERQQRIGAREQALGLRRQPSIDLTGEDIDAGPRTDKQAIAEGEQYFRDRLADPKLLDRAVHVDMGEGFTEVAVPLGGERVSGTLTNTLDTQAEANRVVEQLGKQPGFDDVRSEQVAGGYRVSWGKELPAHWAQAGKQLGYSAAAIKDFGSRVMGGRGQLKTGEEGMLNIGDIHAAITKLYDELSPDGNLRAVGYRLALPDREHPVMIDGTINQQTGVAYIDSLRSAKKLDWSNPAEVNAILELKMRADLGVDGLLALKRFLKEQHPEVKKVRFERAGTTGGVSGRQVELKTWSGQEGAVNIGSIVEAINELRQEFKGESPARLFVRLRRDRPELFYEQAQHASAKEFGVFDDRLNRTGQGANTFGHGFYFSEHPETHQTYLGSFGQKGRTGIREGGDISPIFKQGERDSRMRNIRLAWRMGVIELNRGTSREAKIRFDKMGEMIDSALADKTLSATDRGLYQWLKDYHTSFIKDRKLSKDDLLGSGAHSYEVSLNIKPDEYLHWDKPLRDQPGAIRRKLNQVVNEFFKGTTGPVGEWTSDIAGTPVKERSDTWSGVTSTVPNRGTRNFGFVNRSVDGLRGVYYKWNGEAGRVGPFATWTEAHQAIEAAAKTDPKSIYSTELSFYREARRNMQDLGSSPRTGEYFYRELSDLFGPRRVSEGLHNIGIKGNKYLDRGSRQGWAAGEFPTYNFVAFKGRDVTIKARNKEPLNLGLLDRPAGPVVEEAATPARSGQAGKLTKQEVLDHWNKDYADIKIAPQNIQTARLLKKGESGHLDVGSIAKALGEVRDFFKRKGEQNRGLAVPIRYRNEAEYWQHSGVKLSDIPQKHYYRDPINGQVLPPTGKLAAVESEHAGWDITTPGFMYSRFDPQNHVIYTNEEIFNALGEYDKGGLTLTEKTQAHYGLPKLADYIKVIRGSLLADVAKSPLSEQGQRVVEGQIGLFEKDWNKALAANPEGVRLLKVDRNTTALTAAAVNSHEGVHLADPMVRARTAGEVGKHFAQYIEQNKDQISKRFGVHHTDLAGVASELMAYSFQNDIHPDSHQQTVKALADVIQHLEAIHGSEPLDKIAKTISRQGRELMGQLRARGAEAEAGAGRVPQGGKSRAGERSIPFNPFRASSGEEDPPRNFGPDRPPIDIESIRRAYQQGQITMNQAIEAWQPVADWFYTGSPTPQEMEMVMRRKSGEDPIIGISSEQKTIASIDPLRSLWHDSVFPNEREQLGEDGGVHWRYDPVTETIYWNWEPGPEHQAQAAAYLAEQGHQIKKESTFYRRQYENFWDQEQRKQTVQRDERIQQAMAENLPSGLGGPEAVGKALRDLAERMKTNYESLGNHQALRLGLDVASPKVVENLFKRTEALVRETQRVENLDQLRQAERAYDAGNYGQATALTQQILKQSGEYVRRLEAGYSAAERAQQGAQNIDWSDTIRLIRDNLKTFGHRPGEKKGERGGYVDLRRPPKKGRPDNRLAEIIEPAVERLWREANKAISEKRLQIGDVRAYVKDQFSELLRTKFSDWAPENQQGALAIAAKQLEERQIAQMKERAKRTGRMVASRPIGQMSHATELEAQRIAARRLEELEGPEGEQAPETKTLSGKLVAHQEAVEAFERLDKLPLRSLGARARQMFPEEYDQDPEAAIDMMYKQLFLPDATSMAGRVKTWRAEAIRQINGRATQYEKQGAGFEVGRVGQAGELQAIRKGEVPEPAATEGPNPYRAAIHDLDMQRAPDSAYKLLVLGTPLQKKLGARGETWRGRAMMAAEIEERTRREARGTTAQPPEPKLPKGERARKLYKALEASGRLLGSESATYHMESLGDWHQQANKFIQAEGPAAAQEYYQTAHASGVKTAVGMALTDHYQREALRTGDREMWEKAINMSNARMPISTKEGQAVAAYKLYRRYTMVGALDEATKLYGKIKGVKPGTKLPIEIAQEATMKAKAVEDATVKLAEVAARKPKIIKKGARGAIVTPEVEQLRGQRRAERATIKQLNKIAPGEGDAARQRELLAAETRLHDATWKLEKLYGDLAWAGKGWYTRGNNLVKAFMVSALDTAQRNLVSQAANSIGVRGIDLGEVFVANVHDAFRKTLGYEPYGGELRAMDVLRSAKRLNPKYLVERFARETWNKDYRTLAEHVLLAQDNPKAYNDLFGTYSGGVDLPGSSRFSQGARKLMSMAEKGALFVNTFNRSQEFFVREAEFLAGMEEDIRRKHGIGLEQYIAQEGSYKFDKEMIARNVERALSVTFVENPKNRWLLNLINVTNQIPATFGIPFPRFMYNSGKFLFQHSPLGLGETIYQGNKLRKAQIDASTPELFKSTSEARMKAASDFNRSIVRAAAGTLMFGIAYQMRKQMGGNEWYELKLGNKTFDTRAFGPFSTYLLFAEALRRQWNGERGFTSKDWAKGLGAATSPTGLTMTVIGRIADQWGNGDVDGAMAHAVQMLSEEGGEGVRAVLTPVRQLKKIAAFFDPKEGITRDVSDHPLIGAFRESVPGMSQGLPAVQLPTTATQVHMQNPLLQLGTGLREETAPTYLQQELGRLHFRPEEVRVYTGNKNIDTAVTKYMGIEADKLSQRLETDKRYQSANDQTKFALLYTHMQAIRAKAIGQAARDFKRDYVNLHLKLPYWEQQAIEGKGGQLPQAR